MLALNDDYLTGLGTLIPIDVFNEVGMYDRTHFPQYFADADLSLRAEKVGYHLAVTPESICYVDPGSAWIARMNETMSWRFFIT